VRKDRTPDPVDLMLDGKFDEAAQAYVALYADALKKKDYSIGPDLLMGLQYCVAGMAKQAPTDTDVEVTVRNELAKRHVKIDRHVKDHLQIANSMVEKGRKRAERSVAGVESEKQRRWKEE
jgi:hypothetical protein